MRKAPECVSRVPSCLYTCVHLCGHGLRCAPYWEAARPHLRACQAPARDEHTRVPSRCPHGSPRDALPWLPPSRPFPPSQPGSRAPSSRKPSLSPLESRLPSGAGPRAFPPGRLLRAAMAGPCPALRALAASVPPEGPGPGFPDPGGGAAAGASDWRPSWAATVRVWRLRILRTLSPDSRQQPRDGTCSPEVTCPASLAAGVRPRDPVPSRRRLGPGP